VEPEVRSVEKRARRSFETSGSDCSLTQRHIPEEMNPHVHDCENVRIRNPKVRHSGHNSPSLVIILSHMKQKSILSALIFKMCFNIILNYTDYLVKFYGRAF
jgi:hypothetical protein